MIVKLRVDVLSLVAKYFDFVPTTQKLIYIEIKTKK